MPVLHTVLATASFFLPIPRNCQLLVTIATPANHHRTCSPVPLYSFEAQTFRNLTHDCWYAVMLPAAGSSFLHPTRVAVCAAGSWAALPRTRLLQHYIRN
ncbi:MAG: hypothetical protein J3K34DRAFT_443668 [Monoraphidium minutum]|nr:MAG: hypothetical protein J3K34DRAFT_443668 [Monoraphidium minutum]